MSTRHRPILAPLDERLLQSRGLASENSAEGTRKLHRRRMNRSSDSEHGDISLNVSCSVSEHQSAFVTIPTFLISKATLLHVGFTKARAEQLWTQWNNWPEYEPLREVDYEDAEDGMSFLYFMTGISRARDTTSSRDEDWTAAMTGWGIKPELQQAIIDPIFNSIRHTHSCAFWVKDTIKMRYAALEQTQKTSQERNALLAQGRTAESIERQFRDETQTANARAAAARNAPGHTILYRGMDEGRAIDFVQNWNVNYLSTIRSLVPSDFSPNRTLFYFTPQRFVAQYYAAWVTRRSEDIQARPKPIIIQFSIPNSAIESLSETEKLSIHFPDEEWKKLIWNSHKGDPLPAPLKKYQHPTLIIGTTSKGPNSVFNSLRSWEQVSSRHVLRIGPPENLSTAIQFVFTEEKGHAFLKQNISAFSKQYFDAHEYREWRYANGFD
ncbi:hypothetical protein ARSEF4850_002547 [Beauveria asiatica]